MMEWSSQDSSHELIEIAAKIDDPRNVMSMTYCWCHSNVMAHRRAEPQIDLLL